MLMQVTPFFASLSKNIQYSNHKKFISKKIKIGMQHATCGQWCLLGLLARVNIVSADFLSKRYTLSFGSGLTLTGSSTVPRKLGFEKIPEFSVYTVMMFYFYNHMD